MLKISAKPELLDTFLHRLRASSCVDGPKGRVQHETNNLSYCYRETSNKNFQSPQSPSNHSTPIHTSAEPSTRLEPLTHKPLTQHKRQ